MKDAETMRISRRRFAISGISAGAALLAQGALFAEGAAATLQWDGLGRSARDQTRHENVLRLT